MDKHGVCAYVAIARLHEDPITVELIFSLQIITTVCPKRGTVQGDHGITGASTKPRYVTTTQIVAGDVLALKPRW